MHINFPLGASTAHPTLLRRRVYVCLRVFLGDKVRLQDADAVTLVCSRMKCCVSVLLLFCLAEAHREAQDEPAAALLQDPDPLWAELKELRDMVVEQRVQLRSLEEDSKDLKDEVP